MSQLVFTPPRVLLHENTTQSVLVNKEVDMLVSVTEVSLTYGRAINGHV